MSAVKSAVTAGSIASRAVHLKITPAPRNIRESREILKLVKGYGDLTMFKNMRYDPTSRARDVIIAIFRKPEAATDMLRASPVRFMMEPEKPYGPVRNYASAGIEELFQTSDQQVDDVADTSEPEPEPIEFQMAVDKSYHNHEADIKRRTNYWGFDIVRSFAYDALSPDVPLKGLATMPAENSQELLGRITQKNLEKVKARKSLRQIRDGA